MIKIQNNKLLYGLIGAVGGGFLVWLIMVNGFVGNMNGMMGMRSQQNTTISQNGSMMGNMDKQFIEQMIPHHESAISMAKLALEKSQRSEIKELANSIIASQSEEITKMKQWYKDWYGTDVPENSMGNNSMSMNGGMMNNMGSSTLADATDFDKAFLTQMISHHQMAVMMAQMMLGNTNRPELKQLGEEIVTAQTKEINQMQSWYKAWYE